MVPFMPDDGPEKLMPQAATLLTWLKLMRLPTVFTALSNVLCGFYISQNNRHLPTIIVQPELWLLVIASAGLYLGGMVLNDVFDAELDARERPERPIPSGQIRKRSAAVLGGLLLVIGVCSAWAAAAVSETSMNAVIVAIVLAATVVLYDSVLKNTVAAPLGMGVCRSLNILLGASCGAAGANLLSPTNFTIWVAIALGVYVFGVTWFAQNEAGTSSRAALFSGLAIAMCGLGIDAFVCWRETDVNRAAIGALIALALVAANVGLRCWKAIRANNPMLLQKTVGFMLLNIILIDAAMTFCVTGSGRLATTVVILVIPATLMKRLIPMS